MLEQEPEDPGRDSPHHEQPPQPRVGVVGSDLAIPERPAEALEDPPPVAPEEHEQDDRGGEMRRHEEGEEELVVLVDVPASEPRQDHAVPEARDREGLRRALEEAEYHRLEVRDRVMRRERQVREGQRHGGHLSAPHRAESGRCVS